MAAHLLSAGLAQATDRRIVAKQNVHNKTATERAGSLMFGPNDPRCCSQMSTDCGQASRSVQFKPSGCNKSRGLDDITQLNMHAIAYSNQAFFITQTDTLEVTNILYFVCLFACSVCLCVCD